MKIMHLLVVGGAFAISCLSYFFLAEMPNVFTAETTLPFIASLYKNGVDENSMRRVWHAGWIASVLAPWCLIVGIAGIRWICSHAEQVNCRAVFLPLCVGLSILSFPDPVWTMLPGFDNSWMWMLSHIAFTQTIGRDAAFTYGPMGFLLTPQGYLNVCRVALLANVFFVITWLYILAATFCSCYKGRLMAWVLLLTMFFSQGSMEWRWVTLAMVSVAIPCLLQDELKTRTAKTMLLIGGIVMTINAMIKFSSFIIVAATQFFLIAYYIITTRRLRGLVWYFVGLTVTFVGLCMVYFHSFNDFASWINGSILMAAGSNKYNGLPHYAFELASPVIIFIATVLAVSWNSDSKMKIIMVSFLFSPLLFCTAKYGWVRHSPAQFIYAMAIVAAFFTFVNPAVFKRIVCIVGMLLCITYGMWLPRFFAGNTYCEFPFGINPMGIVRTCQITEEMEKTREASKSALKKYQVPSFWWNAIGKESVMMFPDDCAPVMMHDDANVMLLPTFQLDTGYLPKLDAMNATLLTGANAPEHIVCRIDAGWRSGRLVNYPKSWNAVLSRYEYVATDNGYAWLRKAKKVKSVSFKLKKSVNCKVGAWIELPENCAIAVDWQPLLIGKIAMMFFRNTQAYVSFRYADGTETKDEMMIENMKSPFPLNCIPKNDADMLKILQGERFNDIRAIRIEADDGWYYSEKFILNIFGLR